MKAVLNSTVLIGLSKIGKLAMLQKIFSDIFIPEMVYQEVVIEGKDKPGSQEAIGAKWLNVLKVKDYIEVNFLAEELGYGEAEVLVLAKEINADWVLIDEEKGRNAAVAAGFNVIGVVGLLVAFKKLNFIKKIKPLLEQLRQNKFYISDEIYRFVLSKVGEE